MFRLMGFGVMDHICCICMKAEIHLTKISDCDKKDRLPYLEELKFCIAQVEWKESFKLCNGCATKTNDFYDFCNLCIKTEKLRKQCVSSTLEKSNTEAEETAIETKPSFNGLCNEIFLERKDSGVNQNETHSRNYNLENKDGVDERDSLTEHVSNDFVDDSFNDRSNDADCDNVKHDSQPSLHIEENPKLEIEEEPKLKNNEDVSSEQHLRKKKTKFKEPIRCSYCGRDFKRRGHLSAHIRAKHTLEKPYSCDICGTSFSVSQSLLIHKRRHNNERPYCCTYCGKQFSCSSDLYHHNQIHLNKRHYKCDTCEKSFNTSSILRRHKICAHTDPVLWKYICVLCNRRFPMSSNLKTHLRRHDNQKNFTCEICSNSFYDKFILQRHKRSHTNERLFKCDICEKEYKDNCSLNIHLKKVHDIGNAVIPRRVKNFVCHICPKAFTSDVKLKKHINSHSGTKPFECSHCDKSFTDNWYRKKHLEKKHNITQV